MLQAEGFRENQNTRFLFRNVFLKILPYMGQIEKYGRARHAIDDDTIRRMRFACWMTKATDTHSEYVILIAFPLQQWLRERASMLRYPYISCPFVCSKQQAVDGKSSPIVRAYAAPSKVLNYLIQQIIEGTYPLLLIRVTPVQSVPN
jgi:hypothetical protein